MALLFFLFGISILTCHEVNALLCDDIDAQACQLLAAKQPDLCNNTAIVEFTCPRFCNKCKLECYHCDGPVTNFTDCNTTRSCGEGEVCMLRELKSSLDGHQEYVMTCESKQACDGSGLTFPFGRRDIHERNINVKCCETDLCNYPTSTQPMTTNQPVVTTTMAIPTTTTALACLKDVIFVVDESRSMVSQRQGVLNFLSALVVDLNVSQQGTHVAMGTFTLTSHTKFEFDSHLNSDDLRAAIVGVRFNGGIGDSTAGLAYILNHALKSSSNRPNVPDAVVFITDDKATKVLAQLYENSIHRQINDIVAIGVGSRTDSLTLQQIATDRTHVITENDADNLIYHQAEVVKLLCS